MKKIILLLSLFTLVAVGVQAMNSSKTFNISCTCDKSINFGIDQLFRIALSDDLSHVAVGTQLSEIHILDKRLNKISTLCGHQSIVSGLRFTPKDSLLLSASSDWSFKIWNAKSGTCRASYSTHSKAINDADLSRDGKTFLTASDDCSLKKWNLEKNTYSSCPLPKPVVSVAFSPDDNVIAAGLEDGHIFFEKLDTASTEFMAPHPEFFESVYEFSRGVERIAFSPDGSLLAASYWNDAILVHNLLTGENQELPEINSMSRTLIFSSDGEFLITGSDDGNIRFWRTDTLECIKTIKAHNSWILDIKITPDGKKIYTASYDHTVKLWDVKIICEE